MSSGALFTFCDPLDKLSVQIVKLHVSLFWAFRLIYNIAF